MATRSHTPRLAFGLLAAVALASQLSGLDAWPVQLAGWRFATFALDNDQVLSWGKNSDGLLGLGDTVNRGSSPGGLGDNLTLVNLGVGRHVTQIAAGYEHACALLDDASVKCWGASNKECLGVGDSEDRGQNSHEM